MKAETPFSLFLALNVDELTESVFTEAAFVHAYNMLTEVAKQAATNQLHPSEIPSLEDLLLTLDGYGEYPSLTCNYTPKPDVSPSVLTTAQEENEEQNPVNLKSKIPTDGLLVKLLWFCRRARRYRYRLPVREGTGIPPRNCDARRIRIPSLRFMP